jgi:hypothetical protein
VTATDQAGNTASRTVHYQVSDTAPSGSHLTLSYVGGIARLIDGTVDSGAITVARDRQGSVTSVTGHATVPDGASTARVSMNVRRVWILPVYSGTITVREDGAKFSTTSLMLFSPLRTNGARVSGSAVGFSPTLRSYRLDWSVTAPES